MCLLAGSVLTTLCLGVRPFSALTSKGAANFGRLHIVVAGLQLWSYHRRVSQPTNSFPLFYAVSNALMVFSFELLPVYQKSLSTCFRYISIFNPGVRCYDYLDFGNLSLSFLFVFPFLLCVSVFICFSFESLSHICSFLFPRVVVDNQPESQIILRNVTPQTRRHLEYQKVLNYAKYKTNPLFLIRKFISWL